MSQKPILGLAAWSGMGKTQLLKAIIPLLQAQGLRIALIKHAHHDFDIDKKGKDSYELRKAGAQQVLVASNKRWAMVTEHAPKDEPVLMELLPHLQQDIVDLILIEGFRHEAIPKIEVYRKSVGKPLLYPDDPHIIAIASDDSRAQHSIPTLDLNQLSAITTFILKYISWNSSVV